jgi:hypothetical protein
VPELEAELEGFVARTRPYPAWRLRADRWLRGAAGLSRRARSGVGLLLRGGRR